MIHPGLLAGRGSRAFIASFRQVSLTAADTPDEPHTGRTLSPSVVAAGTPDEPHTGRTLSPSVVFVAVLWLVLRRTPTASAVARIIVLAMGWGLFLVTR